MTDDHEPIPGGWVKLYRCIQSNPLWQERPFDRGRAWVDLILIANHKDGYIRVRGNKVTVLRGQVGYSILSLAERWGWSRGKVSRFLNELENDAQQIRQQKKRLTTLITILNYERYQAVDTTERETDSTTDGQQTDTNKNVKTGKKKISSPAKNPPAGFTLFRDWWMHAFSLIEDDRYIFEAAKDGSCLSSMLKAAADWKEIVCKACHYLVDADRFPKGRPTISGLKSSINRYPGHINGKADHFRELGLLPPDGVLLEDWTPWQ